MKIKTPIVVCGIVLVSLSTGCAQVSGQEKESAGPTGLLGSWQLVKLKVGDGNWQDAAKGEVEFKHITRTQFTWVVVDAESKRVLRGAGGKCMIKGDSYKETVNYYIGDHPKESVGGGWEYTWQFKGEELHVSYKGGQQVWRLVR